VFFKYDCRFAFIYKISDNSYNTNFKEELIFLDSDNTIIKFVLFRFPFNATKDRST